MGLDPATWHAELRIIGQNANLLSVLEQRTKPPPNSACLPSSQRLNRPRPHAVK
jgi:hypothetical protein